MEILLIIIILLFVVGLVSCLLAFPFMWMWNYAVIAALDIANPIDYPVALCLMLFISFFCVANNSGKKS